MHTRTAVAVASLFVVALLIPAACSSWSMADVWVPWRVLLVGLIVWAVFFGIHKTSDIVLMLLAALPIVAALVFTGEGRIRFLPLPGWAWWLCLSGACLLSIVSKPRRRLAASSLVVALSLATVAAVTSRGASEWWRAFAKRSPTERYERTLSELPPGAQHEGLREGGATRVSQLGFQSNRGFTEGPIWLAAERGTHPGPRPVVLWLSTSIAPPEASTELTIVRADDVLRATGGKLERVWDIAPVDVVFCGPDAWLDDVRGKRWSRVVVEFVRVGGAVMMLDEERHPPLLGERVRELPDGTLGHVLTATSAADAGAKLADQRAWLPRLSTVFHRAPRISPATDAWGAWSLTRGRHGRSLALVALYVLALFGLQRAARTVRSRFVMTCVASLATVIALWFLAPSVPAARVDAVVLRLGADAPSRELHIVRVHAGPDGLNDRVRVVGPGFFRSWGGYVGIEGQLVVPPRQVAWLLLERLYQEAPLSAPRELELDERARVETLFSRTTPRLDLRGYASARPGNRGIRIVGLEPIRELVVRAFHHP